MTGFTFTPLIQTASRVGLGAFLLIVSFSKLLTLQWFSGIVLAWGLARKRAAPYLAAAVVAVECLLGILLLLDELLPWTAFAAALLFTVFSSAVIVKLTQGKRDIRCGCFPLWRDAKVGWNVLARNLGLLGLALISILPSTLSPALFATSLAILVSPLLIRFPKQAIATAGR